MNLKRYMTTALVVGLIFGNVFVASAQTATTTSTTALQALIQTLQKQIESLTAQLQTLQRAQTQLQTATTTAGVVDALQLIGQLKEGSSGEKVRLLQAILAADTGIYPEGRITGYYGKLTAQAVKRFQKLHKLEQVGNVGKKTLEKIEKEIEKNPIAIEERDGVRIPCAIVPPGHLIAPGWLRKIGGETPIIPVCQTIPEGIAKKLGLATTTPDVTAPRISDVEAEDRTANSAKIKWETNEPATGMIWYGTSTPVSAGNALTVSSVTLVREHELVLSNLSANATYYYMVISTDAKGNTATSSQYSFTTAAVPQQADVTAPIIAQVALSGITATGSMVTWTTDEPATSIVWYATSTPLATSTAWTASSSVLVQNHSVTLTGLAANTTYYIMIGSADAANNLGLSTQYSFVTMSLPDTSAPAISGLTATSTTASSSHIVWTTDEPATGKIWYATSTPVLMTGAPAISETTLATMHDALISGLATSTTYYYLVSSADAAGNGATSTEVSFQTLAQ